MSGQGAKDVEWKLILIGAGVGTTWITTTVETAISQCQWDALVDTTVMKMKRTIYEPSPTRAGRGEDDEGST